MEFRMPCPGRPWDGGKGQVAGHDPPQAGPEGVGVWGGVLAGLPVAREPALQPLPAVGGLAGGCSRARCGDSVWRGPAGIRWLRRSGCQVLRALITPCPRGVGANAPAGQLEGRRYSCGVEALGCVQSMEPPAGSGSVHSPRPSGPPGKVGSGGRAGCSGCV